MTVDAYELIKGGINAIINKSFKLHAYTNACISNILSF
jgi:hypothetical protein